MTARKRATNADSGSPSNGEPEYLLVGNLGRPHGLQGEILMQPITDFPERLKQGATVHLGRDRTRTTIVGVRQHADGLLLHFQGIDSRDAAALHRNQQVWVLTRDRPPLPSGHFYHHELLGLPVVDDAFGHIGTLAEILQTGANDVYVVQDDAGREVLLPAVAGVVLDLNPKLGVIRVRIPKGIDVGSRR